MLARKRRGTALLRVRGRVCALALALALACAGTLGLLASCGLPATQQAAAPDEVVSQKPSNPDKIQVTMLVKNAFSLNGFERAAEEHFPQLDIVQVGNFSSEMGISEYEARLCNGDIPDIVMTWPLDVGNQYWEDQLLDLSALPFTGKYTTAMLDTISQEGKLFYLPGPSQLRGIVYNKTLFQENGWEVPSDFESFVTLCQTIEASGLRSLQLGLGNEEVLDTAFVGYGYESSFSTPEAAQWRAAYDKGTGSFADMCTPALDTFQTLIDAGILQPADLNITYADREYQLFSRKCAMVEDSVLMTNMGEGRTGTTDEFALMPFFNPGNESDWARLYPVCYIGANKNLAEAQNKEKYDLVMQLFEYISTPEGQAALIGENGTMASSLKGVFPQETSEIKALLPAIEQGRTAVFPTFEHVQGVLREGLAGMVAGKFSATDVIRMVDAQNALPVVSTRPQVLGRASADFTMIETGNFITDTLREETGCDVALFLDNGKDGRTNGKGVSARFYEGELTAEDVARVYPDVRQGETGEIVKGSMTGADLLNTLEYAIAVDNDQTGWFYYFSGLRMEYAPAAPPGTRIHSIKDGEGRAIDPEKTYTVAFMEGSVPADCLITHEGTGVLVPDLLKKTIQQCDTISPSGDGRFVVAQP
ncbi:MAG: extracellular solute-binding protein [Eggerthellaceae bacterium]